MLKIMMMYNKMITRFIGTSIFTFGFLKFFHPFKEWYRVQIAASEMGEFSYAMGIACELAVGMILFGTWILRHRISLRANVLVSAFALSMVMVVMSVGTYVHLHPGVPADVLPLNIKPPFIPLFFLAAALINIIILLKQYSMVSSGNVAR